MSNKSFQSCGYDAEKAKIDCEYIGSQTGLDIEYHDVTASTNSLLIERAHSGAPQGSVIIADHQMQGRGRNGHSFWSPDSTGLYLSLLLRPQMNGFYAASVTAAAAVAASEAIEIVSGKKAVVKWVNDIFIGQRKVCGILAQAVFSGDGENENNYNNSNSFVVLGAGFNVFTPEHGFPQDIENKAGAVFEGEGYKSSVREKLAVEFLNRMMKYYTDGESVFEKYRNRLFMLGREIIYEEQSAVAVDIDEKYRLKIKLENGSERLLDSGEISVLLK